MKWLNNIVVAREAYERMSFVEAKQYLNKYLQLRNINDLSVDDTRTEVVPFISVIIVTNSTDHRLRLCLGSLGRQSCNDYELIIVDNGVDRAGHGWFFEYDFLHVSLPMNVGLSEGRNLGAEFARGEVLLFLDDDGIADSSLIEATKNAFTEYDFLAVRGRVLANDLESEKNNRYPGHYDYGEYPLPAVMNAECVSAVRSTVWRTVDGMDPLILHGEGEEFSRRILDAFPSREIYYWPKMRLFHDYGTGKKMLTKMKREAVSKAYLKFIKSEAEGIGLKYGRWYQEHPAGTIIVDKRPIHFRIFALFREILLRFRIRLSSRS